jgi:hypothetical protein
MMAHTAPGRPLRFFGLLLFAWIAARIVFHIDISPQAEATRLAVAPAPLLSVPTEPTAQPRRMTPPLRPTIIAPPPPSWRLMAQAIGVLRPPDVPADPPDFLHFDAAFANQCQGSESLAAVAAASTPSPTPLPLPLTDGRAHNRWNLSGWTLWRPDRTGGIGGAAVGQLGGSQAGARVDFDLFPAAQHRITAYARATAALTHPAAPEAAIGLAYQPARRLPVSLALERRIALGRGARNAMTVMAFGGFGPTKIAPGLLAEGYGQTGIVGFRADDRFVDGKVSLLAPLGMTPLRLGASLSGGAQPAVHRVDIGPEVQLRLPLPSAPARLSFEWRERIVGTARPASGLAVTLAADF